MIRGGKGEQLRMFMTPREIQDRVSDFNDIYTLNGPAPTDDDTLRGHPTWRKKRVDNEVGLGPSIDLEGVTHPVQVWHGKGWPGDEKHSDTDAYLVNGHHRFIHAWDNNPDQYIPVDHSDHEDSIVRSKLLDDEIDGIYGPDHRPKQFNRPRWRRFGRAQ